METHDNASPSYECKKRILKLNPYAKNLRVPLRRRHHVVDEEDNRVNALQRPGLVSAGVIGQGACADIARLILLVQDGQLVRRQWAPH